MSITSNTRDLYGGGRDTKKLMEFIGKNKADQIGFLTNNMSNINTMISFLDDATASGIWGDSDYAVIKTSANIWEARLKAAGKGFTKKEELKLIKLMENAILMKNKRNIDWSCRL
jgi:hypothetical protein